MQQALKVEGDIHAQLDRILNHSSFAASDRHARFLRFVVEKTLAGRAEEIKEVVIATELYGRSSDYDPKVDSVVRVEATRLRSRLRTYYEGDGAGDPVRITIPKGTYVPQFEAVVLPAEMESPSIDIPALPESRLKAGCSQDWLPHELRAGVIASGVIVLLMIWYVAVPGQLRVAAAAPHTDALSAWQEGNELLRQDPHSGLTDSGLPPTLARAIERYEFAVAKDPLFARGWASVAEVYDYAFPYVGRDPDEDRRRAESAARKAVELAPLQVTRCWLWCSSI